MYSLAEHQQQCQRSLCHRPVSELLLSGLTENHHNSCDSFFEETIGWEYLLHILIFGIWSKY